MNLHRCFTMVVLVGLILGIQSGESQNVVASKSQSWKYSGKVQGQYGYSPTVENNDLKVNRGFRMRRVRLQVNMQVTPWIASEVEFDVRDNRPRLKDGYVHLKLYDDYYLRLGQFKVPVWREQLRSSGDLLLIERGAANAFLVVSFLAGRHIGMEFGGKLGQNLHFALNYSNGSGEGVAEIPLREKTQNMNNGKMVAARLTYPASEVVELGLSAVVNYLGSHTTVTNNLGPVYAIAPDFGIYLPGGLEVEGGLAIGAFSRQFIQSDEDRGFLAFDLSGRFRQKWAKPNANLAGLDGWELAAGIAFIDPDRQFEKDEKFYFRAGPALNFGKQVRFQINVEWQVPTDPEIDQSLFIRSQLGVNF